MKGCALMKLESIKKHELSKQPKDSEAAHRSGRLVQDVVLPASHVCVCVCVWESEKSRPTASQTQTAPKSSQTRSRALHLAA